MSRKGSSSKSTPNEMRDKSLSFKSFHKILCNQLEELENTNSVEICKTDDSKIDSTVNYVKNANEKSSKKSKFKVGMKRVNIF